MSIWFISGTPSNSIYSVVGGLLGAFLSGLVAILIFVFGKKLDKKKERMKQVARDKEVQTLLGVQIKGIQAPLAKQISSIRHFLSLLKTDREQDMELPIVSSFTPNELLFIKKDELYKVLVHEREGGTQAKQEYFFDFRNNLLFLVDSHKAIKTWATDFNNKYQEYVSKFKEHLEKVMRTLDVLGIEVEAKRTKVGEDKFFEATDKVIENLKAIENFQDIHIIYKNLIIPMHKICQDKSIVYGETRVSLILSDVMSAMFYYENYENTRITYYHLFLDLARK